MKISKLFFLGIILLSSCQRKKHGNEGREKEVSHYASFDQVTLIPEYSNEVSGSILEVERKKILKDAGFLPRFIKVFEILNPKNEMTEVSVSVIVSKARLEAKTWKMIFIGEPVEASRVGGSKEIFSVNEKDYVFVDLFFNIKTTSLYNDEGTFILVSEDPVDYQIEKVQVLGVDLDSVLSERNQTDPAKHRVFELHIPLRDHAIISSH